MPQVLAVLSSFTAQTSHVSLVDDGFHLYWTSRKYMNIWGNILYFALSLFRPPMRFFRKNAHQKSPIPSTGSLPHHNKRRFRSIDDLALLRSRNSKDLFQLCTTLVISASTVYLLLQLVAQVLIQSGVFTSSHITEVTSVRLSSTSSPSSSHLDTNNLHILDGSIQRSPRLRQIRGLPRDGLAATLQLACGETDKMLSVWLNAFSKLTSCSKEEGEGVVGEEGSLEEEALSMSAKLQCASWCIWDLRTPELQGWFLTGNACFEHFKSPHLCDEWVHQRPKLP